MSTGSTTLPGSGMPAPEAARRRWPRLHDARISSKLALILVVPVTAVVALAAVRLVDVGSRAYAAHQISQLTELSTDISALTQGMHRERMAAARYLATVEKSAAAKSAQAAYDAQVTQTDALIATYHNDRRGLGKQTEVDAGRPVDAVNEPSVIEDRLERIDDHLRTMDATRHKVVTRDQIAVAEVVLRYGVIITDLVAYGEVLGQYAGDSAVADSLRAVAAFARAKAGAAEQEAVAFAARSSGDLSAEEYAAFVATQTTQQEALTAFSLVANPAQRAVVDETVAGDAVTLADRVSAELSRSVGGGPAMGAQEAAQAIGAVVDLMRWAELRLEERLVADARAADSSVTRQAFIEAILMLLTLTVALALAVVLARSLNRSLRKLREGALSVANRDLPEAVARLRDVHNLGDGGADDIVRQVRDPIELDNRDEFGQVAQAFNVVHREAVRVAAEQAALRTSVSTMFLNLARRSQTLVDRMIGELDLIERGEEDPKRLAQLFELDHLATRMRRNDENLLVLAGADASAPRRENALLVDVLRAAQSEVELYNRVEFGTVDTDIFVAAPAVNDVVRLVAELLDNATRFSPPDTVVVADGRRVRDYVVVQVEDRGLGMSEEHMDGLNRRLAQPPDVDVAAFRLMGLAVVGRLASRYGIRVELRANLDGGTVAQVMLPTSIVLLPRTEGPLIRQRTTAQGDRAVPRPGLPAGRTGAATATLPATSGDSWRLGPRGNDDDRLVGAGAGESPPAGGRLGAFVIPASVPSAESRTEPADNRPGGTPLLVPPTRTPPALPVGLDVPTPNRPALPSRAQRAAPAPEAPPTLPRALPQPAREVPPSRDQATTQEQPVLPPTPSAEAGPAPVAGPAPIAGPVPVVAPAADAGPVPEAAVAVVPGTAPAAPPAGSVPAPAATDAPTPAPMAAPARVAAPATPAVPAATPAAPVPGAPVPVAPVPGSAGSVPTGWGAVLASIPAPPPPPAPTATSAEDRAEAPIFQEIKASWFRGPDEPATQQWSMPTAGYAPPPRPAVTAREAAISAAAREAGAAAVHEAQAKGGPSAVPYVAPKPAAGAPKPAAGAPKPAAGAPSRPGPAQPASSGPGPVASSQVAAASAALPRPAAATGGPGWSAPGAGVHGPSAEPADGGGASRGGNGQNGGAPVGRDTGTSTGGQQAVPRPRTSAEDAWRTAADEGWHRAMAAAEPPDAGKTRSGLPKRVPQAQLVPGGVRTGPRDAARRTPDEVRGLLSAYHRGVQRGRSAGSAADAVVTDPAPKENEQ